MSETATRQPDPEPERGIASLLEEALALHERGDLEGAETLYLEVRSRQSNHFVAIHQLGVLQNQKGDHGMAIQTLEEAIRLNPRSSLAHMNMGVALSNLQRFQEALAHYKMSLIINPANDEARLNQALTLRSLQHPIEALACLDSLLMTRSNDRKAFLNRGSILLELHRPAEALDSFDHALQLHPSDASALTCRGVALKELNRPIEALESHEQALRLEPDNTDALLNKSAALMDLNRPSEALGCLDHSLSLHPDQADALMNRGNALVKLHRLTEALSCFDESFQLQPANTDVLLNRGMALHLLGRHEDAIADFDRALQLCPQHAKAHSAKIFILDYLPNLTFQRHQDERRHYYLTQTVDLPTQPIFHPNDRDPHRPLVVGYVSADFKNHSAAASYWPVMQHHDKANFRVLCYSGVLAEDEVSRLFMGHVDGWVRSADMTDDQLTDRIRQDKVDVLVDLSGHSMGNRLLVFARKPAPIQVTAWGHGGGTGLPMVDYHFTDPIHVPASARPLFAESSFDLPCCITFGPPHDTPPFNELPALSRRFITFGSLNRFSKITPELLVLWARILGEMPNSKLLLKDGALGDQGLRSHVLEVFGKMGVDPCRIEMRGLTSKKEHLATYNEVDVTLDTFPQNGGITTWESLWMGVPVITLLGGLPSGRISSAILGSLGLDAWIASDEEGYLGLARLQTTDLDALAALRRDMRILIQSSPSGNPQLYTRCVESAYRSFWHRWLEQAPNLTHP